MTNKKVVSWSIMGYGVIYLLPHEWHTKGLALDHALANLGIISQGFPHAVHITIGAVLIIYGFLLLRGTVKLPGFLGRIYNHKEKY